jgi:trehalose 6-phosphate phosphatase
LRRRGPSPPSAPIRAQVRKIVDEYRPRKALFIGDDTTGLDACRELAKLREEGIRSERLRIGVESDEGPPEIVSEADLVVEGTEGVERGLRTLLGEG